MKKMLPWLVTTLLAITLIAIVAIIMYKSFFNDTTDQPDPEKAPVTVKQLSADELVSVTSELKDFKRNLKDSDYVVVMSFAFQLDSKKTKEEFDKILEIEVRPIINRTVADLTAAELNGSQGEDMLESKLLNLINPILPEGKKLVKVEITNFIMQQL
ncbi:MULTISPECIES: flagellar basal body-associated FliL family protein [unclassified Paenibacillus]|uniref:flagellar basal body-associated FliL family protein n=1 Tax=unclassified Paenibacillus TaxID=185978 RepID=UPI00104BB8E6|nr:MULTISPECIES: flagellar basal body-associated FliL family protein [unclassified Paenibacillus]NIK68836.1 flagellar FliL protein [Paenibacillus sp. BK720]TCM98891.1 flagellar FliL protein [Paenibacillus sp. BK033]